MNRYTYKCHVLDKCKKKDDYLWLLNRWTIQQNVWHLSEVSHTYFVLEFFLFLLDKLRKHCLKFTHILQLSQSCEQEDYNRSNKFLHLIGSIHVFIRKIFIRKWAWKTQRPLRKCSENLQTQMPTLNAYFS